MRVKGEISRRGRGSGGVESQEKAMGVNTIQIHHNYENIITRSEIVYVFLKKKTGEQNLIKTPVF